MTPILFAVGVFTTGIQLYMDLKISRRLDDLERRLKSIEAKDRRIW